MLFTDVVETVTAGSFIGAQLQALTPVCRDQTQVGCAQGWSGAEMAEILRDNPALGTTFDKKHDKDRKGMFHHHDFLLGLLNTKSVVRAWSHTEKCLCQNLISSTLQADGCHFVSTTATRSPSSPIS